MKLEKAYNSFLKKVAENIKAARQKRGLTQEEMSEYGFNYRHYQKIESGKHSLSLYTLFRLSMVFGVSVEDLVEIEP